MSVDNTNNRGQYTGNGTTTIFAVASSGVAIPFFATSDLVVTLFDTTAGALVSPAPVLGGGATYDYTVAGTVAPDSGEYLTANVTFNTAPLGNHRVTIQRAVPATQDVALQDNSKFPAAVITAALDRLTILVQQALAAAGQSLQFPASDPIGLSAMLPASAARANLFAAFDGLGQMIASPGPSGGTPIAAPMVPVVQAASLAAALGLLGGATLAGNTFTASQIIQLTDPGAAEGPILTLDRNSASPAASDVLGGLRFDGRNDSAAEVTYGEIRSLILDPVHATEDAQLVFLLRVAGALTTIATMGPGLQLGAPTGGDRGVGSINSASHIYVNGVRVDTIAQIQSVETGAVATGATAIPNDDTIPQITEGTEFMTITLAPTNASSTLLIEMVLALECGTAGSVIVALFQDATANALAAISQTLPTGGHNLSFSFRHKMVAGTTSATTFRVRAGAQATVTFNGAGAARLFGGVMASSITVTEVLP